MSDLIRRQDAIDKVNRIMKVNGIPYDKAWFTPIGVITLINELPSAEPERKTGRWIGDVCSECGNERAWYGNPPDYCPDCGARMEGVNE